MRLFPSWANWMASERYCSCNSLQVEHGRSWASNAVSVSHKRAGWCKVEGLRVVGRLVLSQYLSFLRFHNLLASHWRHGSFLPGFFFPITVPCFESPRQFFWTLRRVRLKSPKTVSVVLQPIAGVYSFSFSILYITLVFSRRNTRVSAIMLFTGCPANTLCVYEQY